MIIIHNNKILMYYWIQITLKSWAAYMDIQEKINTLASDMGVHPSDTKLLLQFTISAMQKDGVQERFMELYMSGDMEAIQAITEAYIVVAVDKIKKIIEIYQTKTGAKEALASQVYHMVKEGV